MRGDKARETRWKEERSWNAARMQVTDLCASPRRNLRNARHGEEGRSSTTLSSHPPTENTSIWGVLSEGEEGTFFRDRWPWASCGEWEVVVLHGPAELQYYQASRRCFPLLVSPIRLAWLWKFTLGHDGASIPVTSPPSHCVSNLIHPDEMFWIYFFTALDIFSSLSPKWKTAYPRPRCLQGKKSVVQSFSAAEIILLTYWASLNKILNLKKNKICLGRIQWVPGDLSTVATVLIAGI